MQQAMRLPPFMLFLIVCLSRVIAISSSLPNAYDENTNQMRQQSSWNSSWLPRKAATNSGVDHYALIEYFTDSVLFGGMSTLDVYGIKTVNNQISSSHMCVVGRGKDFSSHNAAVAGWTVSPSEYGDSKTHFFTLWTADGYKSTGCYDLKCDGFVPVQNAPITPGDTLDPQNGKLKITIKIFKKKNDGDWWLYFGYDNQSLRAVGFWPQSIFNNLADHANSVQWGGYTFSDSGSASPAMGSGHWPGIHSATVRDVRFVDDTGRGYKIDPWPGGLIPSISHKKCYGAILSVGEMFYYGGPGGCTM
ncbi:uncharacterized protein LOC123440473 [Hordeum vulgare subsp. vulgare]|uniref:uncharacterized protein LOC123440473 n=1 Tax=Hordeum vulgare subsp. vulgare TaxID=112509 RepID=UPI001B85461B|nr:uncharacterized protein LOC123440473 [Hordeum vulgare subsp. vulgare]